MVSPHAMAPAKLYVLMAVSGWASGDRPWRNEGVKLVRCLRAAFILRATLAPTKLITLRRVDPPKANARPVNFERVAVDDTRLPG